jgi:hypothetical protein
MKKRIFSGIFIWLFLVFFYFRPVQAMAAGRLYLEPATKTITQGESFDVYVWVDPGGAETAAVDAIINFDAVRLEAVSVDEETYFTNDTLGSFQGFIPKIDNENGKISIYSYANQQNSYISAAGKIAKIQFKAKATGTANVNFVCQAGGSGDSSVWDKEATDIIDCNTVGSGTYTINAASTGGETPTSTPTPTPTTTSTGGETTSTPTPTSSQLPQAGIPAPLFLIAAFGIITSMIGLLIAVI